MREPFGFAFGSPKPRHGSAGAFFEAHLTSEKPRLILWEYKESDSETDLGCESLIPRPIMFPFHSWNSLQ
jgi:hypothetical protein